MHHVHELVVNYKGVVGLVAVVPDELALGLVHLCYVC